MPRFLPKLVRRIKASKDERGLKYPRNITPPSQSARRVIPKALPPPSFSPHGRKQSILMDDVNPIIHSDAFVQHKADGPIPPSAARRGKHTNRTWQVREMTASECKWWSDPYLRMLASPLRQCLVTQKQLPADFVVRLAALRVEGHRLSQPVIALLPDGVEHPRFRRQKSGRGHYLTCKNIFVEEMGSRLSYKRIPVSNLRVHALLAAQIVHQLRLRVLQELELLAESLRCTPQGALENIVLRRLTRAEWVEVKTFGRISQPGAVAVLVVPPLNKPKPSEPEGSNSNKPLQTAASLPPVSVLHTTQTIQRGGITSNLLHCVPQVPLYNGLSLFPARSMRSKLHKALQNALLVERRARWREGAPSRGLDRASKDTDSKHARDKASHAYLLRSDENTIRRADSVPLAIALWRIRMWEGEGWEGDLGNYGGWESRDFRDDGQLSLSDLK